MPQTTAPPPRHAATIHILPPVLQYIEQQLLTPLTPGAIARHFHIGTSSLTALFTAVCDIPVMQYIRNRRLSLAGAAVAGTGARIIDIALAYGYETPEAFTKAFARFHGFAPSVMRRIRVPPAVYAPLQIRIDIQGGRQAQGAPAAISPTDPPRMEQAIDAGAGYNGAINKQGGHTMHTTAPNCSFHSGEMPNPEDWRTLLALARQLDTDGIPFKFDGNTMLFAHGVQPELTNIRATFPWTRRREVLDYFGHPDDPIASHPGFCYFDTPYGGRTLRCMFYGGIAGSDDSEKVLYRNTDIVTIDNYPIHVQSLQFFYENTPPNHPHYAQVAALLNIDMTSN